MTDSGNAAQTRIIAEQVAEAAVVKFAAEHPNMAGNNRMAQIYVGGLSELAPVAGQCSKSTGRPDNVSASIRR